MDHKSDKNKKCLFVGNFKILPNDDDRQYYVAQLQPTPAYVKAWDIY